MSSRSLFDLSQILLPLLFLSRSSSLPLPPPSSRRTSFLGVGDWGAAQPTTVEPHPIQRSGGERGRGGGGERPAWRFTFAFRKVLRPPSTTTATKGEEKPRKGSVIAPLSLSACLAVRKKEKGKGEGKGVGVERPITRNKSQFGGHCVGVVQTTASHNRKLGT